MIGVSGLLREEETEERWVSVSLIFLLRFFLFFPCSSLSLSANLFSSCSLLRPRDHPCSPTWFASVRHVQQWPNRPWHVMCYSHHLSSYRETGSRFLQLHFAYPLPSLTVSSSCHCHDCRTFDSNNDPAWRERDLDAGVLLTSLDHVVVFVPLLSISSLFFAL